MTTIDYSTYSLDELKEAKRFINEIKYPENYQALLDELKAREPEILAKKESNQRKKIVGQEKELRKAKKRVNLLGIIQVIAACCLLFLGYQIIRSGQVNLFLLIIIFFLVSFNAICGYTLLAKQKKWYWLSLVNQGLQIHNIALGNLVFSYTAVGTIFVGFNWPGFIFNITALLNPGFQFHYLNQPLAYGFVGVDVLAIIFFFAILTVINEVPNEGVIEESVIYDDKKRI